MASEAAASQVDTRTPPISEAMASAMRKLALAGLIELHSGDQNVVFSPVIAFLGLGLLPSICQGKMRDSIVTALGCGAEEDDVSLAEALNRLKQAEEDTSLSLYFNLVCNSGNPLPPGSFSVLERHLGVTPVVSTFPEPAAAMINEDASRLTHGKIDFVADAYALRETVSVVPVTSVFLDAKWEAPFDKKRKPFVWRNADGKRLLCTGMKKKKRKYQLRRESDYTSLAIEYDGPRRMVIFLPNEGVDLDVSSFTEEFFLGHLPRAEDLVNVDVFMPQWRTDETFSLVGVCKSLGVTGFFSSDDVSGDSRFGEFRQHAFINVTEKGTIAAAVNISPIFKLCKKPPREEHLVFRADHPFVYAIVNDATQAIEFIGCVMTPPNAYNMFGWRVK